VADVQEVVPGGRGDDAAFQVLQGQPAPGPGGETHGPVSFAESVCGTRNGPSGPARRPGAGAVSSRCPRGAAGGTGRVGVAGARGAGGRYGVYPAPSFVVPFPNSSHPRPSQV